LAVSAVSAVLAVLLPVAARAEPNPLRDVFFGETHLHTSWSLDAYAFGNRVVGPDEAYRYAQGEPVPHPGGFQVEIDEPLDFIAVTEHAEYVGVLVEANDPDSALRQKHPLLAGSLRLGVDASGTATFVVLSKTMTNERAIEALRGPEVAGTIWKRLVEIADRHYRPGAFTTFAAYEWTSTPNGRNMHRNVFFRDTKKVPALPFTAIDSTDPYALWTWMDAQRAAGNEVLAIPHNGNLSNGIMFPTDVDLGGRAVDAAWAALRGRNEPLFELKQLKGQSETTPELSPDDEFADYEVFVWQLLGASGDPQPYGSYARRAYRDGVALQGARGFNPHKFGLASGADSHNGAAFYRHDTFQGAHGESDATPEKRLGEERHLNLDNRMVSPAGLTAVWAEENTREGVFDAMRRKEAYATSGVRIRLRFFGGWGFDGDALAKPDWVARGYATGVPMGSELPPAAGGAPTFLVSAAKDPRSANLDRVQIVKGWSRNGQSFERVYDAAWSGERAPDPATGRVPAVGNTVDIARATYTDRIGAPELRAVWRDPDFDPSLDAFYYVRVLEIPTPRWTTIQAHQLGVIPPAGYALAVQERAWSSPIWYTPTAEARRAAPPGTTVADLERRGGVALGDAALRELVVGKTFRIRNTVTGGTFHLAYGRDGRRLVTAVDGALPALGEIGNPLHGDVLGGAAPYVIENGRIRTTIGGAVFDVAVYRVGDRLHAARGDELGFANYEVTPLDD
jgi:hypothetical protein